MPYIKKGSSLIVIGRMNPPSNYTDKEGRQQMGLEVTAEMIEFSPFGKSERQEGNTQSNDEDNQAAQYSKPANYGSQTTGQGAQFSQSVEEDTLPF